MAVPKATMETNTQGEKKMTCLQRFSTVVIGSIEKGFGTLGLRIARYPVRFMTVCVALCLLTSIGLLEFYEESEPDKLWVPEDSTVRENKNWIDRNFPSTVHYEKMIGVSSNILEAEKIQALFDIYKESTTMTTSSNISLSNVCVRAGSDCLVYGILEVWSYDEATISALTDAQVLLDIKNTDTSPLYGSELDYTAFLGSITYDSVTGDITGAKAALITWLTEGNDEIFDMTDSWENKFISLGKRGHSDLSSVYVLALKSWDEESSKAIQSDVLSLSMGYFLVIVFVIVVLGKFNFLEQKAWLTLGGILCVGLSALVSIALSSAFQQMYGPIQSVLPFLLLGLGVDDMFVIMGSLNNLTPEEREYDIPDKVACVLKHAGVSITVTSLTDFVAFMIGATTIIPALRSFCIYAGIGVLALYFLQAIFFTSCLTIDLRRIGTNRDACCCFIKHGEDYRANECSQKRMIPFVFKKGLASLATKLPFKIAVIVVFLGVLGFNIYGFANLENYFDRDLFLPSDSYAYEFIKAEKRYFPAKGDPGHIYCGKIDYFTHNTELESLDTLMKSSSKIINGTTDSWFLALTDWLDSTTDPDVLAMLDGSRYPSTEGNFYNLTYNMTIEEATRTSSYIRFVSDTDRTIKASRFPMTHVLTSSASEEVAVMDNAYAIVSNAGFSRSECFPYAFAYLTWETNKIIREELYRNIGLAMICVFLVSLILIANVVTSLLVFIGVIATLINVAGTMYFWDLTIDTVTSIVLILSVGLSVDYSAHIGHMFMSVKGTKHERVKETIGEMGPAVFYGGFSTFLAFLLLANSNSYIFKTFFKLNFLTVAYGLFHGLIFLPVMLSLLGPDPYPNASLVYKNKSRSYQAENEDAENGGVDNPSFQKDKKNQALPDATHLSDLPPLEKKSGLPNGNSHPTNGVAKDDGRRSPSEGTSPSSTSSLSTPHTPPPEYEEGENGMTVVRM